MKNFVNLHNLKSKDFLNLSDVGNVSSLTNETEVSIETEVPIVSEAGSLTLQHQVPNFTEIASVSRLVTEVPSVTEAPCVTEVPSGTEVPSLTEVLDETDTLKSNLWKWMLQSQTSVSNMRKLLHILKPHVPNIPLDPETLSKSKCSFEILNLNENTQYSFWGFSSSLKYLASQGLLDENYKIIINIDGVPLFKSSSCCLWPILARTGKTTPFVVALTVGNKKPPIEFLNDMVDELAKLVNNPLEFDGVTYRLSLQNIIFVCDNPAKSFIRQTKNHGGFFPCDVCIIEGDHDGSRMCYREIDSSLRTHDKFHSDDIPYSEHRIGESPLCNLGLDFATQFPRDSMHLLYLGIMKKLLHIWVKDRSTSKKAKLSAKQIEELSQELVNLYEFVPSSFARRPRSLKELDRWKATEYRSFLLYIGPVVMQKYLSEDVYGHFLLLSSAARLLSSEISTSSVDLATQFLNEFVAKAARFYDPKFYVYNVHSLLHLPNDCLNHGKLTDFDAFPFENLLYLMKNSIHNAKSPLKQLEKRKELFLPRKMGLSYIEPSREKMYQPKKCDSLIDVNGQIFAMKNAVYEKDCWLVDGYFLDKKKEFFQYPILATKVGVHCLQTGVASKVEVQKLDNKYYSFVLDSEIVAIKLLHFE